MSSSVYEVSLLGSDKHYIGVTTKTVGARWRDHVSSSLHKPKGKLQRELRKFGEEAFGVNLRAELPTFQEAQIAERILIALEEPRLNATLGGEGRLGISAPPGARRRGKGGKQARPRRAAHCAAISASKTGKPGYKPSAETRAKLSAAQTGNTKMLGRKHSPETRAKMSALAMGKKPSDRKTSQN